MADWWYNSFVHSKTLPEVIKKEIRFETAKASGPGGQNVNKRNTKVLGLWNFSVSRLITQDEKNKISQSLRTKINMGRTLIVSSQKHRSQIQNKKEVIDTMVRFVNRALKEEKPRVATKPTASGIEKRIATKKNRSKIKKLRSSAGE